MEVNYILNLGGLEVSSAQETRLKILSAIRLSQPLCNSNNAVVLHVWHLCVFHSAGIYTAQQFYFTEDLWLSSVRVIPFRTVHLDRTRTF